jgi:hypothetical protein
MSVSGFFAKGIKQYELPHPVAERQLLVVNEAVRYAFQLLREEPPDRFVLNMALENEITRQLHWILDNRLIHTKEVKGFNKIFFKNVIRAPELTNVDGNHPDKKPDLVFYLKRDKLPVLSSHDAIFAECKPVNKVTHKIPPKYCRDGLIRFINGDYAWTMQEGLMIGYVKDDLTIHENLATELASAKLYESMGSPTPPLQLSSSEATEHAQALHVTQHQRDFNWPEDRGRAADIRIYHSWHSCS